MVNDAATLPASLRGHTASGAPLELRLSAPPDHRADATLLRGVLFGAGDHTVRTEHRPAPPALAIGEHITFGAAPDAFAATVLARQGRLIDLAVDAPGEDERWRALYRVGRPVQYAHRRERLPLYAVQTAYAARPWAAEMPSAGRALTWESLLGLRRAGVELATLTHAAGLSSTGEPALDAAMPWPERYELPTRTAAAIAATRARGGRVIAVGTTVVRALEASGGAPGTGIATLRLDAATVPRLVDGVVSGLHLPGESHFELLAAFAPRRQLLRAMQLASEAGLSAHELGDACLVLRDRRETVAAACTATCSSC